MTKKAIKLEDVFDATKETNGHTAQEKAWQSGKPYYQLGNSDNIYDSSNRQWVGKKEGNEIKLIFGS